MNSTPSHPIAEKLSIPGPIGDLEALLESPVDADNAHVVVVCHPHPVYGGTMTNKVVHMLARSCNEAGVTSVRFNYRGVGASPGNYDEGNGETQDTLAVLDWVAARWPQAQLWLAGFSFGGAVAIRAASRRDVGRLITVAPAVQRVSVDPNQLPRCPWLLVQGDKDELVDAIAVQQWVESLATPPQLAMLPGVDHFFHGRLNQLREVVLAWLRQAD
jgi:alpha/beta superfamily hydrolase